MRGILLAILMLIPILFTGCADDLCGNDIIKTVESPDHDYVAYLFKRSCGATTEESFQLSILKKEMPLENKKGNVYISNGDFEIEWTEEDELRVIYWSSEVFEQEKKYKNITIKYIYKK